jgi:hypothetical protein
MKKHNTTLIEGTFALSKAKKLLLELLSYKINYHQIEKFSNEERFGVDREHSEKRIKELTEEKQALARWMELFEQNNKIKIDCNIKMEIIK